MAASILILGAGPTGIGAALRMEQLKHSDYLILEATDHAGGLASSYLDDQGFTWDVGGHVQFSHYDEFDQAMNRALGKKGWWKHERASYIWMNDTFVPYPFQNNIRYLHPNVREECIQGLEAAAKGQATAHPQNFEEWIYATFGDGIAKHFLLPYNRKVWAMPLQKMDFHWFGDRVSVPNMDRVRENIRLNRDDVSWGPNDTFRFPKEGGTGAVWRSLVKKILPARLHFQTRVTRINLEKREAITSEGDLYSYDVLLSSLPIDEFCRLTGDQALTKLGNQMVYSSSNIVGVGLKGTCPERLQGKCWMYFPESTSPFYRVTVFSHYSPGNVPDPSRFWSLMTETSESVHKPIDHSKIVEETIQGLLQTKLIERKEDVISTWYFRAAHGYPTPFLGRDSVLNEIQKKLLEKKVYSRGRFGGWKYEVSNQDHSFMQGWEAVGAILKGEKERTYYEPHVVNAPRKKPYR